MKVYDVELNDEKGVYAISVVEQPAMEGMFIALKDQPQEIQLKEVDTEKRILMGVALVPDKKIYRNVNGEEFFIKFSKETVEKAAHLFLTNGFQNRSTLEHELELQGMSVVESWIIEDEDSDKSRKYGFDHPVGSWMVSMKVNDDTVWNEFVKKGKIKGFSIDGMFSLKELKLNRDMSLIDELKDFFKKEAITLNKEPEKQEDTPETPKEEVKLGSQPLDNGTMVEYEGETLEAGTPVFIMNEDEERVPLPTGEYTLEDGRQLIVAEEGIAGEIREAQQEEQPEELTEDKTDVIGQIKDLVAQLKSDLSQEFDVKLTKALEEKDQEIKELKTQLSNEEAAKPIKHAPKEVKVEMAKTPKGRITNFINTL